MAIPQNRVFLLLQKAQVTFRPRGENYYITYRGHHYYLPRADGAELEYKKSEIIHMVKQLRIDPELVAEYLPELGIRPPPST